MFKRLVPFSQDAHPGSNIPVLFYIFGGQFKYGGTLIEGPEFFMSKEIVLVMVSSRLGALGWLSTGDTVIPGNMALKDQVLGMKWTRENIYHFGGDPYRITIHGHSSGSICTHLHTFSPMSRGFTQILLIQRARKRLKWQDVNFFQIISTKLLCKVEWL